MARKEALVLEDFHIGNARFHKDSLGNIGAEKIRDHVLEQFNGKLLEGGFRVTNDQIEDGEFLAKLLDAMLPELPAAKVKKK